VKSLSRNSWSYGFGGKDIHHQEASSCRHADSQQHSAAIDLWQNQILD